MESSLSSATKLSSGGRIVIPVEMRKELDIDAGDEILLRMKGRMIELYTRDQAIREIQERVRQFVPEGVSLADELIAERRVEAANE